MSTSQYKDYTIIAAAKRDPITGEYQPFAHITWKRSDGSRDTYSMRLPTRCATFEEASSLAERTAKTWADHQSKTAKASLSSARTAVLGLFLI
jgi:hypothetical protein